MKSSIIDEAFKGGGDEKSGSDTDAEIAKLVEKEEIGDNEAFFMEAPNEFTERFPSAPWVVTRAFQIAFWHCLYYCRHALPLHVLYMVHTIQQLGASSWINVEGTCQTEYLTSGNETEKKIHRFLERHRFGVCDGIELLLRLALRKGVSFSQKQLGSYDAAHLKVNRALGLLEKAQFIGIPCTISSSSHFSSTRKENETHIPNAEGNQCFLYSYAGETIAPLFSASFSNIDGKEHFNEHTDSLSMILSAVSAQDLRRVATEMYRFCRSHEESSVSSFARSSAGKEAVAALHIGIPTRKRDVILYLIQGKYASFLSGNSFSTLKDSEYLNKKFTTTWNNYVGKVYVIHPEVKYSVKFIARLFHVITSNFCGLSIGTDTFRHTIDLSMIAGAPGFLFHYYQLHVLDNRSKVCSDILTIRPLGEEGRSRASLMKVFFLWSTFSLESSSIQPIFSNVQLFSSTDELERYWKTLQLHAALYQITDGAVNFAKKLMGRDLNYVLSIFQSTMELLSSFHNSHSVGVAENLLMQEQYSAGMERRDGKRTGNPIFFFLYKDGLLAAHLLQFTPQYRLYACLELLFPLFEYLRRYQEAVSCLEVLLFCPLFVLYPLSSHGGKPIFQCDAANAFSIKYRCEKRGHWMHRLGMNLSHLKQWEKALGLLEKEHERWEELRVLNAAEKKYLLRFSGRVFTTSSETQTLSSGCSGRMSIKSSSSLVSSIERRGRMLRALWPHYLPFATSIHSTTQGTSSTTNTNLGKAEYHAVMEYLFERYCHRSDRLAIETLLSGLHKKIYRWTPLKQIWSINRSLIQHPQVLHVNAIRDPHNPKVWKDQECESDMFSCVEQMVLRHFLLLYNERESQDGDVMKKEEGARASLGSEFQNLNPKNEWNGVHCEGRWIAFLAEILLRDALYADLGVPHIEEIDNSSRVLLDPPPTSCPYVWLSRFQNGPLDAINPIIFSHRRRRMIEDRLNALEVVSDEEFRDIIESGCYKEVSEAGSVLSATALPQAEKECVKVSGDDEEIPSGRSELQHKNDNLQNRNCLAAFDRVYLNDFPLLEMALCIPRKSLLTLLRCMFLGVLFDGFSYSTSGFPDLVLWKAGFSSKDKVSATYPHFRLMEVKSPHDELSTKQIAMNDTLLRCGFDVAVVRVHEAK